MPDQQQMIKRQQVLADFGDLALRSEDLDEVLTEACRLVGAALGTDRAKVLEIQEDGGELLVRAGVGWDPSVVGQVRLPMSERSSETFSIREGKPVISQDISKEERFDIPEFMKDAGVTAIVNVPIFVPGRTPYGLLQVDAKEPREFGQEDIEFLRTYATLLGPVIDRLQKVHSFKASEERFRAFVTASSDVVYRMSADWSEMRQLEGQGFLADTETPSENWLDAYILPEDRPTILSAIAQAVSAKHIFALEHRVRRADGRIGWTLSRAVPILDGCGEIIEWLGAASDITPRKEAEEALRASEERFAQFAASSSDALWIRDAATLDMEYISPACRSVYGVPPAALLDGAGNWTALIMPEDRDRAFANLEQAKGGEAITQEFRVRHPASGGVRWIRNTVFPLRDADGHVQRVGGIAQDMTEIKLAEERQDVLVAELQHRTRNLIAVVKGIASDTMRETGPAPAFRAIFADRLSALSRVQGLLSRSEAEPITIGALVRLEVDAVGAGAAGGRVMVDGPDAYLRPSTVQTLALALHELATNARKYGALSHDRGNLAVTWREDDEGGEHRLALEWVETGLEQAPERTASSREGSGYGRELIERALPHALGARTSYALTASGVRCTIDLAVRSGEGEP